MKEPVYIVDGSGYIFRAYYAIRPLTSSKGVPTNAVYGFCTMLQKLIKDHQPKYLAIAFDTSRKTFRSDLYPEYKAHRPTPPEDLVPQFELIRRAVDAFDIPQFAQAGFEADDLIGTLTRLCVEAGHPVVIVTGDKDMMQLVGDHVCLLDELRASKTGSELFITPQEVVKKFGVPPEKVVDLLALTGDASDNVPGVRGIGEKTAAELVIEYGSLESILNSAPFIKQKSRREKLIEDSDLARLSKQLVQIDCHVPIEFELSRLESRGPNFEKLEALFEELDFKKLLLDFKKAPEIRAIENQGQGTLKHVAHDAKRVLMPGEIQGDPMVASYLLDPDARHDWESICGRYPQAHNFEEINASLEDELQTQGLWDLYHDLEIPVENVLAKMEKTGVLIDTQCLENMSVEFGGRLKTLETQAYELAACEFNLASPKQVADVLFGRLALQSVKKTKTSQSTDAEVLEELSRFHPLPKILLEHRMLSKLKGTYIDALPKLVNPQTGRVHTCFNQTVAATGRLSSSDPNLQNIPIRGEEGRRIREAFIAPPGYKLISMDYSQIELRLLAHVSRDPLLCESFLENQDVHRRTASEIFEISLERVSEDQRRIAKTINFGILYGMGAYKLSETLGITRAEATRYLKRYHERYVGVFQWQEELLEKARREKQVKTLMGRRRFLRDIESQNHILKARAERIAVNTPIQGTAADLVKKAMIDVDRVILKKFNRIKMLLQVHDELLFEVPIEDVEPASNVLKSSMEQAYVLRVPMCVQVGIGDNWSTTH